MTSRNDITGDKLQSKVATKEYADNYDKIYGTPLYNIPNNTWVMRVEDEHVFFFGHIDGAYSYCKEVGGAISHYSASMKVKPIEAMG